MSIVVVGSVNVDLVMRTARAPSAGETLTGHGFSTGVGGKGLNQCAAVALQSHSSVSMVACVGKDDYGAMCLSSMSDLGVNLQYVDQVADVSTGLALIVVEDSGDNRILLNPGANEKLSIAHMDRARHVLESASLAIFQLESPIPTIQYAVDMARHSGVKTLLNPAPAVELSDELLQQLSFLIPNESEAAILTKQTVVDPDSAIRAGRMLLDRGVHEAVIVTLGSQGCVVVTHEEARHVPAKKVQVLDSTAYVNLASGHEHQADTSRAGDSFIGGFAAQIVKGDTLIDAVEYGQRVAAITVTREGALKSIPRRSELES